MRKPLKEIRVASGDANKDAPARSWRESGPEWGGKVCAVHQVGPGFDAGPVLQGLAGGVCPVPHWGYCFRGKLTLRYQDGVEEVIQAGDAFYMRPGHTFFTPKDASEDCELIEFSELADVAAMESAAGKGKRS